MKKILRSPVTWITFSAVLLVVIMYIFGFRITYSPKLENDWDAISACAGWAAVVVSGLAIYFAIQAPKKIAEEQNRIALFEKNTKSFSYLNVVFRSIKLCKKVKL